MVGKKGLFWKDSKIQKFLNTFNRCRKGVEGYSVSVLTHRVRNLNSIRVKPRNRRIPKLYKNPKGFKIFTSNNRDFRLGMFGYTVRKGRLERLTKGRKAFI